jgi:hypothetical protein
MENVIRILEQTITTPLIVFAVVLMFYLLKLDRKEGIIIFISKRDGLICAVFGILFGVIRLVRISLGKFDFYYSIFFGLCVMWFTYFAFVIINQIIRYRRPNANYDSE